MRSMPCRRRQPQFQAVTDCNCASKRESLYIGTAASKQLVAPGFLASSAHTHTHAILALYPMLIAGKSGDGPGSP